MFTVFLSTPDDLVINIGNVADVGHRKSAGFQPTHDYIEDHHHPRVANVAIIVNRHPADIHPHLTRHDGLERLLLTGEAIENLQHQRFS